MLSSDSPRPRIRQFLEEWLLFSEGEFPAQWPALSPSEFNSVFARLRSSIQQLYSYVDKQPLDRNQKLSVRLFGESALHLLRLDWEKAPSFHTPSREYVKLAQGRPDASVEFDQLYCTHDSAERRAARFCQEMNEEGARILFLGDDDLVSLAASQQTQAELHMLDLDERLLSFVAEKAPSVQLHKVDLEQGGIPDSLAGSFDAVYLDPPWDYIGCWFFLNKAMYCLKEDLNARIYLSFTPTYLEYKDRQMHRFWKRLGKLGWTVDSMEPCFSLYDMNHEVAPGYRKHLDGYVPDMESPLLECLMKVPYTFSHLYVLRRLPYHRLNPLSRWWFRYWNRGPEVAPL